MQGTVVALVSAFVDESTTLTRGGLYSSDDPVVRSHPHLFTDDPGAHGLLIGSGPSSARAVETATAAPGESRSLTQPRKVKDTPQA
jgi:hypothetical protein